MVAKRLPDGQEAIEGAALAAANAVRLLSDADLLAEAGSYGRALSMAVLAFEESVKARTLGAIAAAAAQGRQPGFSDDALRRIIYNDHRARHAAGFIQHLAAAFPEVYGKVMIGMAFSPGEITTLEELARLVSLANAGKQAGFYTDFDPDSGSWSAPAAASSTEFGKIRALIGDYVAETRRQVDEFRSFRSAAARSG